MDIKVLLTVLAVAVVACLFFTYLTDDGGKTDYTLLDSTDNIAEGLTVNYHYSLGDYADYTEISVVDKVEGDKVTYTLTKSATYKNDVFDAINLRCFLPNGFYVNFDYTIECPQNMDVANEGPTYILNGVHSVSNSTDTTTIQYDNFVIEYDGVEVKSVAGSFIYKNYFGDDESGGSYIETHDMQMIGGRAASSGSLEENAVFITDKERFFYEAIESFNPERYADYDVEKSSGEYKGCIMDIYTLNGSDGVEEFKDLVLYVYDGFEIKYGGTIILHDGDLQYTTETEGLVTIKA